MNAGLAGEPAKPPELDAVVAYLRLQFAVLEPSDLVTWADEIGLEELDALERSKQPGQQAQLLVQFCLAGAPERLKILKAGIEKEGKSDERDAALLELQAALILTAAPPPPAPYVPDPGPTWGRFLALCVTIAVPPILAMVWIPTPPPSEIDACDGAASAGVSSAEEVCLLSVGGGFAKRRVSAAALLRAALTDAKATPNDLGPLFVWVKTLDPAVRWPAWSSQADRRRVFDDAKPLDTGLWVRPVVLWGAPGVAAEAITLAVMENLGGDAIVFRVLQPRLDSSALRFSLTWAIAASTSATVIREVATGRWEMSGDVPTLRRVTGRPLPLGYWEESATVGATRTRSLDDVTPVIAYVAAARALADAAAMDPEWSPAIRRLERGANLCRDCLLAPDIDFARLALATLSGNEPLEAYARERVKARIQTGDKNPATLWSSLLMRLLDPPSTEPWPPEALRPALEMLPDEEQRLVDRVRSAAFEAIALHRSRVVSDAPAVAAALKDARHRRSDELALIWAMVLAAYAPHEQARLAALEAIALFEQPIFPTTASIASLLLPEAILRRDAILSDVEWSRSLDKVVRRLAALQGTELFAQAPKRVFGRLLGLTRLTAAFAFAEKQALRRVLRETHLPAVVDPQQNGTPFTLAIDLAGLIFSASKLAEEPDELVELAKQMSSLVDLDASAKDEDRRRLAVALHLGACGATFFVRRFDAAASFAQRAASIAEPLPRRTWTDAFLHVAPAYLAAIALAQSYMIAAAEVSANAAHDQLAQIIAPASGFFPDEAERSDAAKLLAAADLALSAFIKVRAGHATSEEASTDVLHHVEALTVSASPDSPGGRVLVLARAVAIDGALLAAKDQASAHGPLLASARDAVRKIVDSTPGEPGSGTWFWLQLLQLGQDSLPIALEDQSWWRVVAPVAKSAHSLARFELAGLSADALHKLAASSPDVTIRYAAVAGLLAEAADAELSQQGPGHWPDDPKAAVDTARRIVPVFDRIERESRGGPLLCGLLSLAKALLFEVAEKDASAKTEWTVVQAIFSVNGLPEANGWVTRHRARIAEDEKRPADALALYDEAIGQSPAWEVALRVAKARVLENLADPEGALRELRLARTKLLDSKESRRASVEATVKVQRDYRIYGLEFLVDPSLNIVDEASGEYKGLLARTNVSRRAATLDKETGSPGVSRNSSLISIELAIAARELAKNDEAGADKTLASANAHLEEANQEAARVSPDLAQHVVDLALLHGHLYLADGLRRLPRDSGSKDDKPWLLDTMPSFADDKARMALVVALQRGAPLPQDAGFDLQLMDALVRPAHEIPARVEKILPLALTSVQRAMGLRAEFWGQRNGDLGRRRVAVEALVDAGFATEATWLLEQPDDANSADRERANELAASSDWNRLQRIAVENDIAALFRRQLYAPLGHALDQARDGVLRGLPPTLTRLAVLGSFRANEPEAAVALLDRLIGIEKLESDRTRLMCWRHALSITNGSPAVLPDALRARLERASDIDPFRAWRSEKVDDAGARVVLERMATLVENEGRFAFLANNLVENPATRAAAWEDLAQRAIDNDSRYVRLGALMRASEMWSTVPGSAARVISTLEAAAETADRLEPTAAPVYRARFVNALLADGQYERQREELEKLRAHYDGLHSTSETTTGIRANIIEQIAESYFREGDKKRAAPLYRQAGILYHTARREKDERRCLGETVDSHANDLVSRAREVDDAIERETSAKNAAVVPGLLLFRSRLNGSNETLSRRLDWVARSAGLAASLKLEEEAMAAWNEWIGLKLADSLETKKKLQRERNEDKDGEFVLIEADKRDITDELERHLSDAERDGHRRLQSYFLWVLSDLLHGRDEKRSKALLLRRSQLDVDRDWNIRVPTLLRLGWLEHKASQVTRSASLGKQAFDLARAAKKDRAQYLGEALRMAAGDQRDSEFYDRIQWVSDTAGAYVLPLEGDDPLTAAELILSMGNFKRMVATSTLADDLSTYDHVADLAARSPDGASVQVEALQRAFVTAIQRGSAPQAYDFATRALRMLAKGSDVEQYEAMLRAALKVASDNKDRAAYETFLRATVTEWPEQPIGIAARYDLSFLQRNADLYKPVPPALVDGGSRVLALQMIATTDSMLRTKLGEQLMKAIERHKQPVDLLGLVWVAGDTRDWVRKLVRALGSNAIDQPEQLRLTIGEAAKNR